jgi:hypothetical protein
VRRPRIHDKGGSNHLAVGPAGEIAVRIAPLSASGRNFDDGVDLLAVSTDAGGSWHKHSAPGRREWVAMLDKSVTPPKWTEPEIPRWVEPVAWDSAGRLYSLWTNREGLWLARSADRGVTWRTWQLINDANVLHYPYLAAHGRGELAATWFSGRADTLKAHVARIAVDDSYSTPRMIEVPPFQIDSWDPGEPPRNTPMRDSAGEYLAVAFLRNGAFGVVSPIQNRATRRFGFTWRTVAVK